MMKTSNAQIYFALVSGILFTGWSIFTSRKLPKLADFISLALSAAAAYSALILCYEVLDGSKKLGDFQDQKLTIVLGSITIIWVATLTAIRLVKRIKLTPRSAESDELAR